MSDGNLNGYEPRLSPFGGHPLRSVAGMDDATARALAGLGLDDAEQVIASASVPEVKPHLAQALGGSEADLDRILGALQSALPASAVAAVQAPALANFALGALVPTAEVAAEIEAAAVPMPQGLAEAVALPANVNYAKQMPPVRNQGGRGTCVAHALTAVHEFYRKMSGAPQDFSEQFLYHETKLIDGAPNACGTWQVKAATVLSRLGECREAVWNYNPLGPCNNNGNEPASARTDAAGFKLPTIVLNPKDVNAIKSALAGGSVVGFSIPVYNSWYQSSYTRQTGRINMRLNNEPVAGGHAMCLIGYQDDPASAGGGFFILRNSWDTTWGSQCPYGAGNGTIPYAYIANDCWEAVTTAPPKRHVLSDKRKPAWPFRANGDGEHAAEGERPTLTIDYDGRYDIVIR